MTTRSFPALAGVLVAAVTMAAAGGCVPIPPDVAQTFAPARPEETHNNFRPGGGGRVASRRSAPAAAVPSQAASGSAPALAASAAPSAPATVVPAPASSVAPAAASSAAPAAGASGEGSAVRTAVEGQTP